MQEYTHSIQNGGDAINYKLIIAGGGALAHLEINLSSHDTEEGDSQQKIEVDFVLDQRFHIQIAGMDGDQANAFAKFMLENSDLDAVERRIRHFKQADGVIGERRVTDVAGQTFDLAMRALAAAVPSIMPLVEHMSKIDHPVWQSAYWQKNPFFGSDKHRALKLGGKDGVQFDFAKLSLWVANDGIDPDHWIVFRDHQDAMRFVQYYPANKGGGTMHIIDSKPYLQFGLGRPANGAANPENLMQTIQKLSDSGLVASAEVATLGTHLTLLGAGARTLDLRPLISRLKAREL